MANRTGRVILSRGINLDNTYTNILDYSESDMVTLCESKAVAEFTNCSFLRPGENVIEIEMRYGQAIQANYIAFQNPDYSNKWFFGFIDEVEYRSDKVVRVHYTIDELSTWFDYWNPRPCFVVREHTNDDTVGNNTLPENVDLGEFIFNGAVTSFGYTDPNSAYMAVGVSELLGPLAQNNPLTNWLTVYGGIYSGLYYMFFSSYVDVTRVIDYYDREGKGEAIVTLFYCPIEFVLNSDPKVQTYALSSQTNVVTVTWLEPTNAPMSPASHIISKPTQLAGYTPKNNKLLTYPYCFFNLTNNAGTEVEYRYEDFSPDVKFNIDIALCPSMSIKTTPDNYKGGDISNTWSEGIVGAKTPQCSWNSDYYVNWLTQNGINLGSSTLSTGETVARNLPVSALSSALTVGVASAINPLAGAVSLAGAVGSTIAEQVKASKVPDQVKGNVNAGDINFSKGKCCFTVIPKCIKPEYARIIDDWFTMFGYKTSRLKVPNQTGRKYWNYVQIAQGESIGVTVDSISVPSASMDIVNSAYQRGVTIWHDHANIGNYTLNNTIVTP